MKYENINKKIEEMREEILASIKESVAIESVKGEAKENAPYGEGPKKALDHALALGEKLGFKTGNLDNRIGWVEYGEGEEMAAVLGHVDIVPLGEGWDYDPLGCEIHDGKMYGRGVLDDKGPTIAAIYGLKAIRDLELPIDRRIRVIFGCDEENGSSCVQHYVESGAEMPTIGFTPDADFPVIFFEKGQSFWELTKRVEEKSTVKVLSIKGGTAKNVVMPRCTMVVEGDFDFKETEAIKVTKENGNTVIVSNGRGAHGSTPHLGTNSAIQLFKELKAQGINLGGDLQRLVDFVTEKIGDETQGESLGAFNSDEETGNTSVCLGMIDCTEDSLEITLDIRYPNHTDRDKLVANVKKSAEAYGLEGNLVGEGKMLYVSKESELVQKLVNVYTEETGDVQEPIAIGGGTYAKAFNNMVAFGPIFPGDPDVIHQPNECADVEKMIKSYQIITAAMYEIACK